QHWVILCRPICYWQIFPAEWVDNACVTGNAFPHTWFAADQDDASRHNTTAQHTREFFDGHGKTRTLLSRHAPKALRFGLIAFVLSSIFFGVRFRLLRDFIHGVPFAARRALAHVTQRLFAARAADVVSLDFRQGFTSSS